uniref:PHD-type domain-containing protein n=2 Tax=Rhodnius prolixus TaxID=13249 RepID=T1HUL8_RHOPR
MAKCGKCNVILTRATNVTHARCDKCNLLFHLECVGFTPADWSTLKDLNKAWFCNACNKEMRVARTDSTPASPAPTKITSGGEMSALNEVLKAIQNNTSALNNFIESQKMENPNSYTNCGQSTLPWTAPRQTVDMESPILD